MTITDIIILDVLTNLEAGDITVRSAIAQIRDTIENQGAIEAGNFNVVIENSHANYN